MTPDDFQSHVIDSLARLETHMTSLIGNGQPGRVTKLEKAVAGLVRWKWIITGVILSASALIHFVFRY